MLKNNPQHWKDSFSWFPLYSELSRTGLAAESYLPLPHIALVIPVLFVIFVNYILCRVQLNLKLKSCSLLVSTVKGFSPFTFNIITAVFGFILAILLFISFRPFTSFLPSFELNSLTIPLDCSISLLIIHSFRSLTDYNTRAWLTTCLLKWLIIHFPRNAKTLE